MKEIKLTKGKVALVDDEDYEELNKYKWSTSAVGDKFYAVRSVWSNGKSGVVYMHRHLTGYPKEVICDHVDGDGLNNTRKNLRPATRSQSNSNGSLYKNNTTGYRGVTFNKNAGKFLAQISHQRKHIHLGVFDNPEEAARAYDRRAKEIYGEFAYLNFPNGEV